MPHLIISDAVGKQLHQLIQFHKGSQSDDRIRRLKDELATPPQPNIKDAYYEKGCTVLSHQCLVDVASISQHGEILSLNSLLRGAKVALPIKPKPERVSNHFHLTAGTLLTLHFSCPKVACLN